MRSAGILLATLTLSVSLPRAGAQAPSYTVEFLGSAASLSDMNNSGEVIGSMTSASSFRAWVARPGHPITLLPLPPGRQSSFANSINDLGVIVGQASAAYSPEFGGVAIAWFPNAGGGYDVVELGALPGHALSNATANNNVGDIVGTSSNGTYRYPVRFTPQGVVDLTSTGVFDPKGINDARVLVDATGKRLDLTTLSVQSLGVPMGQPSNYNAVYTRAINASGQVIGEAILATSTNCDRQAARFTDGIGWQILSGCGSGNAAVAINALGDTVMRLNLAPYVLLEGLGTFRIEDLIVAPVGHWFLFNSYGLSVNDSRRLAVFGHNPTTGESGVLLLTPQGTVGTPGCAGDGSGGSCPCGNSSAVASGQGCVNSSGGGAKLSASGSASVSASNLVLLLSDAPAFQPAVFLQGSPGMQPLPFLDGLLCLAAPVLRLQPIQTNAAGTGASSVPIALVGGAQPGHTWVYQAWFRDPQGPCGTGSNLSASLRVVWQ